MSPARGRLTQAVINLFQEATIGDVLVVPSPIRDGNILIGQFASRRIIRTRLRSEYGNLPIPARRVEWLDEIEERKVSVELAGSLRHQHPLSLLENSLYNEVFSVAYKNFYSDDVFNSMLLNENDDFLDRDAALIGLMSNFSAYANFLNDHPKLGDRIRDFYSAYLDEIPIEYACSLSADIHSAGFTRLISGRATAITTAALLGILIALATYSSQETIANDVAQIAIVNSLSAADDICTPKVSGSAAIVLRSIGFDELWRACQIAKVMQERTGLDPGVRATERPAGRARPR
jgi:hypothetical protein